MTARERIFVALDVPDADRARALVRLLAGRVGGFKIGLELFVACGPALVDEVVATATPVFLDLKLHDIPNTVAGAAASATRLGVAFLTVHALGGAEMIRRAVDATRSTAGPAGRAPSVLAVTILTSHADDDLNRIGIAGPTQAAVARLAGIAREGGAAGIVCSPLEVARARAAFAHAVLVVPGIRPAGASVRADDQARTASATGAIAAGADRLVIGRPITQAPDPLQALEELVGEIEHGEAP